MKCSCEAKPGSGVIQSMAVMGHDMFCMICHRKVVSVDISHFGVRWYPPSPVDIER